MRCYYRALIKMSLVPEIDFCQGAYTGVLADNGLAN